MSRHQWAVVDLRPEHNEVHVVPHPDDWHDHTPDCWCAPKIEAERNGDVVVHNEGRA